MNSSSRVSLAVCLLCLTVGCPMSDSVPPPPTPATSRPADTATAGPSAAANAVRLTVKITDVRNGDGDLLVGVFRSAAGFPADQSKSVGWRVLRADGDHTATFDLPPGAYAVGVLHDENRDQKMDTGFLGIPKEGYGVSNNPKPRRRAATFDEARFDLPAGRATTETVSIQYDFL